MPNSNQTTEEPDHVHAYAIRRVNPFLGVLQVIETEDGRAISANGVVWDIEVLAKRSSSGWGSLNRNIRGKAYYRYGLWSLQDGLVARPLAPHLESDPLTHKCQRLISCIRQRLEQLPFCLQDNRELWLFDQQARRPLVLLASATADSALPSPEPKYWSACIGANGVPSQRRFPATRELEAQVKQGAGFNIDKRWVTRQDDGSAIIHTSGQRLDATDFPAFLIAEDWSSSEHSRRVSDYIDWTSPALLTLQHLNREERERLEKSLTIQAISVEHHWHLYPDINDEKRVNAARVQCRLQKSSSSNH
jgi:hypothetical protein